MEYEVRRGKPFVELIIAGRAWLADLIVVGGAAQKEQPFLGSTNGEDPAQGPGTRHGGAEALSVEAKTFLVPTVSLLAPEKPLRSAHAGEERFCRSRFFHVLDLNPSIYDRICACGVGRIRADSTASPEELEPEWEAFLSGLPLENVAWRKAY